MLRRFSIANKSFYISFFSDLFLKVTQYTYAFIISFTDMRPLTGPILIQAHFSPSWCQSITLINANLLSIDPLLINFSWFQSNYKTPHSGKCNYEGCLQHRGNFVQASGFKNSICKWGTHRMNHIRSVEPVAGIKSSDKQLHPTISVRCHHLTLPLIPASGSTHLT